MLLELNRSIANDRLKLGPTYILIRDMKKLYLEWFEIQWLIVSKFFAPLEWGVTTDSAEEKYFLMVTEYLAELLTFVT